VIVIFVVLRVQNQVSNVIGIMKDNISRVMDRGEKLDTLEEKSGKLLIQGFIQGGGGGCGLIHQ
jgi:hypothetical protein